MKDVYESIIVFTVMFGILLPVRLLFVEFVSDDWLGSFGVITAISVSILILAKKGKLGEFGNMLQRQIEKLLKGKRKFVVYAESAFMLILLGGMIFAINEGNTTYLHLQDQFFVNQEIDSPETIVEHTNQWETNDWIYGIMMVPVAFLTAFPQMSAVIALFDGALNGWLLHFYTVGFVEYVEFLGILLLYRFGLKTKPFVEAKILSRAPIQSMVK